MAKAPPLAAGVRAVLASLSQFRERARARAVERYDLAPWIEFNTAQGVLFQEEGAPSGELVAQLLVSGTIWLVIPFVIGLLRLLRAEPK